MNLEKLKTDNGMNTHRENTFVIDILAIAVLAAYAGLQGAAYMGGCFVKDSDGHVEENTEITDKMFQDGLKYIYENMESP